jgi:hypothetical protein
MYSNEIRETDGLSKQCTSVKQEAQHFSVKISYYEVFQAMKVIISREI